jgi:dTDP-4-amino-4,6-dideoxygalactose transaminase
MTSRPAGRRTIGSLAVFGGTPAFTETLHVGRPYVGNPERILARLRAVLESGRLTNDGPCVRELESRIAARLGVAHCVATCSGSIALQLLLRARGVAGDVIVPAFTFVATVHALQWLGLTPIFADIDAATHQVDPRSIAARFTSRTDAILGVHLWGSACDADALHALAADQRVALLFDAAHAFASSHRGRMIGGCGDAEAFSFHATKFFHTVEGGAVTTNDGDLAARVRLMRDHGFRGPDTVVGLGVNGKMSEICAAVGLALLEDVDQLIALNKAHHARYAGALAEMPGVRILSHDDGSNHQYVVAEIDQRAGIERDTLLRVLHAERVRARRYFYPGAHRMQPYASRPADARVALPRTDAACARVLCFPTGAAVSGDDIDRICDLVRFAAAHGAEIQHRLRMA